MGKHMSDFRAAFLNNAVPMNIINDDGRLCSVNRASTGYFRGALPDMEMTSPLSFSYAGLGGHPGAAGTDGQTMPTGWQAGEGRPLAAADVPTM